MTIDWTPIILAVLGLIGTILGWRHETAQRDKQASDVLASAIKNSVGAAQQVSEGIFPRLSLDVSRMNLPPERAAALQYVLDNAGEEAARFGKTSAQLSEKIGAQIGLANVQANLATAASPAPSPQPLDAVAPASPPLAPQPIAPATRRL